MRFSFTHHSIHHSHPQDTIVDIPVIISLYLPMIVIVSIAQQGEGEYLKSPWEKVTVKRNDPRKRKPTQHLLLHPHL